MKTLFALRYEDIKVGTGPEAESNKMYKVHYTGWLGSNGRPDDGRKFDSSYERRTPVMDKDGKMVMDADKKPKMSDPHPEPFAFPQGFGRLIPGWDQGFSGMRIGGKRRLFIPWQLAYGAQGRPGPDAANPGIPPKSDLIFDVELLDVTDLPMPPNHPGMPGMPGAHPMPGGMAPHPPTPAPAAKPSTPAAPSQPAAQTAPAATTAPAQPQPK
jgi:peptidylprolyl isomerase